MRRFFRLAAVFALVALMTPAAFAASGPAVAVLNFNTQGLTGDWWGNFEPGVAVSDLLTDQLVNGGKFNVLDRAHLGNVLQEHNLSTSGEVSPASAISTGQLIGARYLITGNVLQLDKTGQSGGTAGGIIGGFAGGVIGGVNNSRVTIKVAVHVIDAQTGQIVQAFDDEETKSNLSIGFGGFGGGGFGSYSNSNFENSTMGHLVNDEAGSFEVHERPRTPVAFGTYYRSRRRRCHSQYRASQRHYGRAIFRRHQFPFGKRSRFGPNADDERADRQDSNHVGVGPNVRRPPRLRYDRGQSQGPVGVGPA